MAETQDWQKYIPEDGKDVPVAGEDVYWDEKRNAVVVKNAYGTSVYDPSGKLLYGKGALYDTNIGSVSGKNVQLFGRNQEIGLEQAGLEQQANQARIERQRQEAAYGTGGTTGLVSYLTGGTQTPEQTAANLAAQQAATAASEAKTAAGRSAYNLLFEQFNQYGLGALIEPLKNLIVEGLSPAEFTIRLRDTDAYKKRFAANAQRIAKGLSALSEAEYIAKEDAYQNVMRNYGLPESYYTKGDMGRQEGFEKLIAGDVSAAELEDRIQTAQSRVINAAPEIKTALKSFYPDITNGDILAYALDPDKALSNIKRKVGAAEIGGAALQAGLETGLARAEELQKYGVDRAQALQGYQTIGGGLQRGSELASIYSQSPYTQTTAEQEVFGLPSAQEARKKRQNIIGLERATFGGQTGAGGAFERERAGGY